MIDSRASAAPRRALSVAPPRPPHIHMHTHTTNSPVRSNPDTYIIRRVLASFGLVPGLEACRKLIVCDGFQVAAAGAAPK